MRSLQCPNCSDDELVQHIVNTAINTGKVTNPEGNPLEVWITPDGRFRVSIPNELYDDQETEAFAQNNSNIVTAQTDDETVKECKNCREPTVFKKDNHDNLHCSNCGLADPKDMTPPFPRTLPFPPQKNAQIMNPNVQNVPKKTEIDPLTIPGQNKRKGIITNKKVKTPAEQQDINDSADALGL